MGTATIRIAPAILADVAPWLAPAQITGSERSDGDVILRVTGKDFPEGARLQAVVDQLDRNFRMIRLERDQ